MNDSEQSQQHRAFGALDWPSQKHSAIVVNQTGKVIDDFEIEQSALGWKEFREKLCPYGSIPFAIETSQGAAVEQLMGASVMVYPLNPKSGQVIGNARPLVGSKTIGWTLGVLPTRCGSIAKTGKPKPEEPLIKELRLLCRDEVTLIEQRTAFIQQLRQALAEYYPAALEAFEDWTSVSAWMFLQRFSTPDCAKKRGSKQ